MRVAAHLLVGGMHAQVLESAAQFVHVDAAAPVLIKFVKSLADGGVDAAPCEARLSDRRSHALVGLQVAHQPLELRQRDGSAPASVLVQHLPGACPVHPHPQLRGDRPKREEERAGARESGQATTEVGQAWHRR